MDKRQAKRWKREHGPRTPQPEAAAIAAELAGGKPTWVYHKAQWNDLVVSVMPRIRHIGGSPMVEDSNTGFVLECPRHPSLLTAVVVDDGKRVNCDERTLDQLFSGPWRDAVSHPYTVPRPRTFPLVKEEDAIQAMIQGKGYTRRQAEALTDQILGWAPYSIACMGCQLEIGAPTPTDAADQARTFGWLVEWNSSTVPLCPTCAIGRDTQPFPTREAIQAMEAM